MKTKLLKAFGDMGKARAILSAVLCLVALCGCAGEVVDSVASTREGVTVHELGTFEGLSAETEQWILQDYFDAYVKSEMPDVTVNDIWVSGYYGTYSGCVVLDIRGPWAIAGVYAHGVEIVGEIIYIPAFAKLWKDGQFISPIENAYEQGFLTEDDLRSIAGYLNLAGDSDSIEPSVHELGTFEGLSAETEKQILQEYFNAYIKPGIPDVTVNDIWVGEYYGTYNDCVVLNIQGLPYFDAMRVGTLAGIEFDYAYSRKPAIWKDGQFCNELHEAYDLGLLTQNDLRSIAGYLNLKK